MPREIQQEISEFENQFASDKTSGVRDFAPDLVRSLSSDTVDFDPKVDISIPLACDRLWYFRRRGVDPKDTSRDRYLNSIGVIKNAGSKRIIEEKLSDLGRPFDLVDNDLGIKSRVDLVYSYNESDPESGLELLVDQIVCVRFVPYFIFKELRSERGISPDARRLLVWNMGMASNATMPDGRTLNVVGGNLVYLSLDGSSEKGMQLERKLGWDTDTFKEYVSLISDLEDLATRIDNKEKPEPNPSSNHICTSFCSYWRVCDYGSQVVEVKNGKERKPLPKKPKKEHLVGQMSFDLRVGEEVAIESNHGPDVSAEKICFDCEAPLIAIGSNGNVRFKCPNCGEVG